MQQFNIFDEPLDECCSSPITGFYRDGFCHTDDLDRGIHVVCAERWKEAYDCGKAPKLFLKKSNKKALTIIKIEILKKFSLDLS